jgi:hypothetical protein
MRAKAVPCVLFTASKILRLQSLCIVIFATYSSEQIDLLRLILKPHWNMKIKTCIIKRLNMIFLVAITHTHELLFFLCFAQKKLRHFKTNFWNLDLERKQSSYLSRSEDYKDSSGLQTLDTLLSKDRIINTNVRQNWIIKIYLWTDQNNQARYKNGSD